MQFSVMAKKTIKPKQLEIPKLKPLNIKSLTKKEIAERAREVETMLNGVEANYKDLVKVVEGKITGIEGKIEKYKSVIGEPRLGGPNSYRTHKTYSMEISLDSEVKKIIFDGWPNLRTGDDIRIYILSAEETGSRMLHTGYHPNSHSYEPIYAKRDLKPEEKAIRIERLLDGKVQESYGSVPDKKIRVHPTKSPE